MIGAVAFERFLDDAAMFPPASMPLTEALAAHHRFRAGGNSRLLGPLVVTESSIDELGRLLGETPEALRVAITFPSGASTMSSAIDRMSQFPVQLVAVEVAVPEGSDLASQFAEIAASIADGTAVYVEVPRGGDPRPMLDEIVARGFRAKFRTGGVTAEKHPDEAELARTLRAAVAAGAAFKATAGLHHALRHTDHRTGFEQHGFLNLLIAVAALRSGEDAVFARRVLGERSSDAVAWWVDDLGAEGIAAARESFVSIGTCSIGEGVEDLLSFGLIEETGGAA